MMTKPLAVDNAAAQRGQRAAVRLDWFSSLAGGIPVMELAGRGWGGMLPDTV
jgi:hypothetical protein